MGHANSSDTCLPPVNFVPNGTALNNNWPELLFLHAERAGLVKAAEKPDQGLNGRPCRWLQLEAPEFTRGIPQGNQAPAAASSRRIDSSA